MKHVARLYHLLLAALLGTFLFLCGLRLFYDTYSSFEPLDDEGYFIWALRSAASGKLIYQEFYTQYGPFFYDYYLAAHRIFGFPLTNDGVRLHSIAALCLVALALSLSVYRTTRSGLAACLTLVLAARQLPTFSEIPAHPNELIILIAATTLLASGNKPPSAASGVMLGAASALIFAAKFNVGLFFLLACLSHAVFRSGSSRIGKAALSGAAVCISLLPFVLLRHLVAEYFLFALGLALSLALLLLHRVRIARRVTGAARHLTAFLVTLIAVLGVVFAPLYASGLSLERLAWGTVLQHRGLPIATLPAQDAQAAFLIPAILSTVLFLYVTRAGAPHPFRMRILRRICILVLFTLYLWDHKLWVLCFGTACLWVFDSNGEEQDCADALHFSLMLTAYMSLAVLPIAVNRIPQLLLCVPFVHLIYAEISSLRSSDELQHGLLFGVLLLPFAFFFRDLRSVEHYYSHETISLGLPGAVLLHVSPEVHRNLIEVCSTITSGNFDFLTIPGMNSFYLWTGKTPPGHFNTTLSGTLLTAAMQNAVLEDFAKRPRRVVVANWDTLARYKQPRTGNVLYDYVNQHFRLWKSFGSYQLLVERSADTQALLQTPNTDLPIP